MNEPKQAGKPQMPKGGSGAFDPNSQAQQDRYFLMSAWLDLSKQVISTTIRDISHSSDAYSTLPTKVVEELKRKIKEGLFDV